jgi:hypothetical protein
VEEAVFFFEKKNQKTSIYWGPRKATPLTAELIRAQEPKIFCSFFQKIISLPFHYAFLRV